MVDQPLHRRLELGASKCRPWIRRRSGHWHATLGRHPRIREEAEQPHVEPRPCSDRFVSFSKAANSETR